MGKVDKEETTGCCVQDCWRPGRAKVGDDHYCIAHLVEHTAKKQPGVIGVRHDRLEITSEEEPSNPITPRDISAFIAGMVIGGCIFSLIFLVSV